MAYHQPARYGYCDSYFVDAHDDGAFALRTENRERLRSLAKMHQRNLGTHLSRVTSDQYRDDVVRHMEHMETLTLPDVHGINLQTEIEWYMRPYLLDFLVEAHAAFQLLPETLFLAVNLLDRYCSRRIVYKRHYQLVGCAALLIAAKYGDRKDRVPTIRELKSMCCALYDDDMFLQMEGHVLQTLQWSVGHPTMHAWVQLALEGHADAALEHVTLYLAEIALFHKVFVGTAPSVLARSCLALARFVLSRAQPAASEWAAAYDAQVVVDLSAQLYAPSQVLAKKYSSMHLSSAAVVVDDFLHRQAQIARRAAGPVPSAAAPGPKCTTDACLGPQTPQKPPSAPMATGVLTPPITPENEQLGLGHTTKEQVFAAARLPTTPTHDGAASHAYAQQ